MLYVKMPSGFGVDVFYNVYAVNLFSIFYYFLPLGKTTALHFNKVVEIGPEQT